MNSLAVSVFPPFTAAAYSTCKKDVFGRSREADFVQFSLYHDSTPGEWQYETVMCASPMYPSVHSPYPPV